MVIEACKIRRGSRVEKNIMRKLAKFLPDILIIQLEMTLGLTDGIQLCLVICRIVKEYDCDLATEIVVVNLLDDLCRAYFRKRKEKESKTSNDNAG